VDFEDFRAEVIKLGKLADREYKKAEMAADNGGLNYWRGYSAAVSVLWATFNDRENPRVFEEDPFSKCVHTEHPCVPYGPCCLDDDNVCTTECGDYVRYREEPNWP
jgi:hypothetical protein